ncbi:3',5'-cyclic-AMP phosphodiesterase [Stutzerimonas tarimensis]|uniref:3',5'-cyclic-AMP phosphodiesterase n=1 Tax=Stutzerimonas tarimensis TaxID=1507735 RepID=A0ABV7T560_9GAMM
MAVSKANRILELVQITDSHLFADAHEKLLGLETRYSLERVVDQVLVERPRIDLVLATGDLSQDGSPRSYELFREQTRRIGAPKRWCPGNHDDRAAMLEASRGSDLMQPVVDLDGWRIILLDSLVPGAVFGQLEDDQLQLLESALTGAAGRHCLICLHHHPVDIGSRWMDAIGLRNADRLFAVIRQHHQVRGLIWGHVHQAFDAEREGVRLLASPSTCMQFEPGSEDFQIGAEAPGYRWLRLHPDGQIETAVSRVAGLVFEPEDGVKGY